MLEIGNRQGNTNVTKVGMGVPANNITDEADVIAPTAAGFLPGWKGFTLRWSKNLMVTYPRNAAYR